MPVNDRLSLVGYSEPTSSVRLQHIGEGTSTAGTATIAEEVPVAIVYNGRPHVIVMATPHDLEDLAYGFSITEAIIEDSSEIEHVEAPRGGPRTAMQVTQAFSNLLQVVKVAGVNTSF